MSGDNRYICGMEGGGTRSNLVICDANFTIVSRINGPGTNHWILGRQECARRIVDMVNKGKNEAGISESQPLACLSLCLSGCEEKESNILLENEIRNLCPTLMELCIVHSDTFASIATATDSGGMVVISGTGSNAILRDSDGTQYNCGGWGHLLGEKGSAWWISQKAINTVIDDQDKYDICPYNTEAVWRNIKEHFKIEQKVELLDHFYGKFEKNKVAGLCEKMSVCADSDDKLCKHIFYEAGKVLGRHVTALLPQADPELLKKPLKLVCVGSVWKSWQHLRDGFVNILDQFQEIDTHFELNLVKLTKPGSVGAMYLAADEIKLEIPKNYEQNFESFFVFRKK